MIFGTAQRLSKINDTLSISYRGVNINVTSQYKYLGIEVDSSLNLNSHFDNTYKKATGRLKLLNKLRNQLDEKSTKAIYNTMIVPTVTHNCVLQGNLSAQQKYKLNSIVRRAKSIIKEDLSSNIDLPSLENETKRQNCFFVRKCLDGNVCEEFRNYFVPFEHRFGTRNKGYSLRLPMMKTEYGKRSVYFNGAKIYNALPIEIRKEQNFKIFKEKVKSFYY